MAESVLPVDLLNPGQVFACLGIMEAADTLLGDAVAVFDWSRPEAVFRVSAAGVEKPVDRIMRFLEEASIVPRAPAGSDNVNRWNWGNGPEIGPGGNLFPFPDPNSPETLPAVLRDSRGAEIVFDYWGDATRRDNVKFWTGPGGYPGAAILRDALDLVRGRMRQYAKDPFSLSSAQTNSFRFDWRRDYISRDIGFSPDEHKKKISMLGFPLVEILAAVGVTNARPRRVNKLEYQYGVLGGDSLLDPMFLRAGLGAETPPIPGRPFRRFVMRLDWPGREGLARCITLVTETTE